MTKLNTKYQLLKHIKPSMSVTGNLFFLNNESKSPVKVHSFVKPIVESTVASSTIKSKAAPSRQKRSAAAVKSAVTARTTAAPKKSNVDAVDLISSVWKDGVYLFVIQLSCKSTAKSDCQFNADVTIKMRGDYGWLSAIEWPLLPFYGIMCIIYLFYGFLWLVLCARYWRDLLRIQFCISGVILLGMLEKAAFYAEYQRYQYHGPIGTWRHHYGRACELLETHIGTCACRRGGAGLWHCQATPGQR